jgi:hypothetical protein
MYRGWSVPRPALVLILIAGGCIGERDSSALLDPIPDIPRSAQRRVSRGQLGLQWPFKVGQGTIGCASGAMVFRSQGINYALNDAAKSRGFSPVDPIWEFRSEGWPSNPLKRIPQDLRKKIFTDFVACKKALTQGSSEEPCKQRARRFVDLTDAELSQIEAEGIERRWPPESPNRKSLDPLLKMGAQLCQVEQ